VAGVESGRDTAQASAGEGSFSGVKTRGGAAPRPVLTQPSLPADIINGAFADLTEDQRRAFRRNMPWIVDSLQQRMVAAGKLVSDDLFAKAVKEVMQDYEKLVERQEKAALVDDTR
jgi:hypothetical protein